MCARSWLLSLSFLAAFALPACTNPADECEAICDWYLGFCDEDRDVCLDDCAFADADQFSGAQECVDTTPSSCRAASCCVAFAYDAYNYEQECLQN